MPLDTEGFTDLAFGVQPEQNTSHGLYAEFYAHPVQNKQKTLEAGRPIYEEVDYIKIMVPGDKSSVIERPVRMGNTPMNDNHRFAREFALYQQGSAQQLVGTPLTEWPIITRSQCRELEHFNCHTVEQLAEMPDTAVQNHTGVGPLRDLAKRFMVQAKEGAPMLQMQTELGVRDEQIAAMQEQINELIGELGETKGKKKKD